VAGADGAVRNFMHLLDDFFVFKAKQARLVASSYLDGQKVSKLFYLVGL